MNPAVTIAAGIVVWLVTAFVKRDHWPSDVNLLLAMVVAAVVALAVVLGQDVWVGTPLSWSHWTQYATADFFLATLIYGVLTVRVPGLQQAAQGIARLTSSPSASSAATSALPSTPSASPTSPASSTPPTSLSEAAMAPTPRPDRSTSVAAAQSPTRAPAPTSPVAGSARVSAATPSTRSTRSTRPMSAPTATSTPSLTSALSALSALVASAPGPVPIDHSGGNHHSPAISGPIPGTRRSVRPRRRSLGQYPPLQPKT